MKFTIIIFLFSVLLSKNPIPDSTISFKGHKLDPLNMNIKNLISQDALRDAGMNFEFLSSIQIDSVKLAAKDYIPSAVSGNDIVIMETSKGIMKIKLFNDIAPNHCLNFKKLANSGFYDGTTFHRVIPGFMIQGGDILSRDGVRYNDGKGNPGWTVNQEFNDIPHKRGILSMARGSNPNSGGSQFFICVGDAPWLDKKYTVFGEVLEENTYIIDRIAKAPTDYSVGKISCVKNIPEGENPSDWVVVEDPKTNQRLYSKVPEGNQAASYKSKLQKDLRSDNPVSKVTIKKVRVVSND